MLRESVRAFPRRQGADRYVRARDDVRRARRRRGLDGLRELGVVGLLVREEHGGAGMGMVDAAVVLEELGRAVCPAPYASSAIGAVSLVLRRRHELAAAGPGRRLDDRHVASTSPARGTQWRRRRRRVRVDGETAGGSTAPRCTSPTRAAADLLLVTALDADGELGVFAHRRRRRRSSRRRPSTASRKQATVTFDGAPARRLEHGDADRRGRAHARPARRRVRGRRRGRGAARARARGRVREGARAVRQADRLVPSRAAPVRRHAAHASSSAAPRATTRAGPLDDAAPDEAHRAATLAQRVRGRRVPAARRHRDPGVRRHRLHVGARHPPVLQAPALAVASRSAPRPTTSPSSPRIAID